MGKLKKHITTKQQLKKARAIEAWQQTQGHVTNLCQITGITRKTFYRWMRDDPDFAKGIVDAEYELNDDVREALIHQIADGNMTAIIFYLKNRHPDFKPQSFMGMEFKKGDESVRIIVSRGNAKAT